MRLSGDVDREVAMIHYLCRCCGMSATCVVTDTSSGAWEDHMSTHADPEYFESWAWMVVPLGFATSSVPV